MLSKAQARTIALSVAGTSERPYFNKPSIFFGEDFLAVVHEKHDAVALRTTSIEMRDVMLEAEPALFYITDHYRNFPMLLVRLSVLDAGTLRDLLRARIAQLAAKPAKRAKKKIAKPAPSSHSGKEPGNLRKPPKR